MINTLNSTNFFDLSYQSFNKNSINAFIDPRVLYISIISIITLGLLWNAMPQAKKVYLENKLFSFDGNQGISINAHRIQILFAKER